MPSKRPLFSKKKIRDIYNESEKDSSPRNLDSVSLPPYFTLADLIGEEITSHRKIKTLKDNPKFLDILYFESGRCLITGVEGWGDGTTHHHYLVENDGSISYSNNLFNADVRRL